MIRATTCTLLLLVPAALGAQGLSLTPYTAVDRGMPGAPPLVGLSATVWSGGLGLRAGGAMDAPSSPVAPLLGYPPAAGTAAWTADLDLIAAGGPLGLRIGPVEPALFVGFGAHALRDAYGEAAAVPSWSYGVAAATAVTDWLSLDAEARYRMPHESDEDLLPPGVGGGWELRVGTALHLGRRRTAPRPAARPVRTVRMGGGRAPAPGPAPTTRRSASAAEVAERTLDTAERYVGVRYEWGGESPSTGFDCSGFVQYVFARNGVRLPRVSRDQARAGEPVTPAVPALLPGDLMFYAGADGVVNHVAIYAGRNRIIHSSSSGRGVRLEALGSRRGRYYATRMVAARRVIPDGLYLFGF